MTFQSRMSRNIFAAILVLFFVLSGATAYVLNSSYRGLEDSIAVQNTGRVSAVVSAEENFLSKKISDWATWDDTYQFLQDHNTAYIDSNLSDDALVQLNINLIAYFQNDGTVFYAKAVDISSGQSVCAKRSAPATRCG